jgi:Icc-related predicted phosphoesterase
MKIQLASDLHLDIIERAFPGERLIAPAPGAELLVLAGDIGNGAQAIDCFAGWPVPVLYVAGNHEFYGKEIEPARAELARTAKGSRVRFLDNAATEFGGVRFLGATLWTDYRLYGDVLQQQMMDGAQRELRDHQVIRTKAGRFTPVDALKQHRSARDWLTAELAQPYDGKTVVITHHGPHPASIHPRYAGSPLNASFVSAGLDALLAQADWWLHGHVHDSFDYPLAGCRVVANPRGYALNRKQAGEAAALRFENARFDPACVLDI